MVEFFSTPLFLLTFTLGVYLLMDWVYKKCKIVIFHPLITSATLIILFLNFMGIDYQTYKDGSSLISFMLGPSVVALGYILHEQFEHIRKNGVSILISTFVGSIVGVVSVIFILRLFGSDAMLEATLAPKSVTTPIAIQISEKAGGLSALTAVIVVVSGLFGAIVGPTVLTLLHVKSPVARGLSLGAAAHGVGTARALEMGALEGAIGGLAIGVMGVMTAVVLPVLIELLKV